MLYNQYGYTLVDIFFFFVNFLKNRTISRIERQAFATLQLGFLRSEENVLYNFDTPDGVWENVLSCNILTLYFLKTFLRADVMP